MTKKWYQSWTVWVNFMSLLGTGILSGASYFTDVGWQPPESFIYVLGFANLLLRFKTDSAIKG